MTEYPPCNDVLVVALQRLLEQQGGHVAVGKAAKINHQSLYQIATQRVNSSTGKPKSVGPSIRKRLDQAFPGWLDAARPTALPPQIGVHASEPIAPLGFFNAPRVSWGAHNMDNLPTVFSVVIPDDSMAPRVRRGDVVRFSRGLEPRPGDGVLLVDPEGRWFFRQFRERRPGEWEAHPLNGAYQALDSQQHRLQVIAVLTGIEQQRWG